MFTSPNGESDTKFRGRFPLTPLRSMLAPLGAAMSDSKMSAAAGAGNRTGVYLAVLQLVFTLGWTTYVIYLPKLCAQVGIAPSYVILILMLDQEVGGSSQPTIPAISMV